MRGLRYRCLAMGIVFALLGTASIAEAAQSNAQPRQRKIVKATFVKPNERNRNQEQTDNHRKPNVLQRKPVNTPKPVKAVKADQKPMTHTAQAVTEKKPTADQESASKQAGGEPVIRVLLGNRSQAFSITSASPMVVLDSMQKKVQTIGVGQAVTISSSSGIVHVNGQAMGQSVTVQNEQGRYGSILQTLGKTYRGAIMALANASGTVSVINVLGLEQYVQGVVPEEVVPSWPAPALEAQAVAARTYAMNSMNSRRGSTYDIGTTTSDQVYGGKSSEYASTNAAVNQTRGMVITYQGKPINALFHSDGGGYTEDSVNLWGNDLPYLKGVQDYSNHEGTTVWNVITSRESIEKKLAGASKSVGALKQIELTPLTSRPMKALDRGVSGRIKSMKFVGERGTVTLTGEQVQGLFGLKSTLFDMYIGQTPPSRIDGSTMKVNHTFGNGNQTVTIHGYGWGHGLGLSQWGAAEMASRKEASQPNYYKVILEHYYQGTAITKLYN